ncbi:MAG: alpha/beta fold hydrolase [Planctomycetaceae bacterium]
MTDLVRPESSTQSRAGVEKIEPVRFGSPCPDLYGCHHPPMGRAGKPYGVLLCQPYGPEYLRSHRAFRQLAGRLARAGFPVFRFDYFGCGDSLGEDHDGSIERWAGDVSAAVKELKGHAEVDRVIAVGLRLGGALAALAGAERGGIDGIALWDPVTSGDAHIEDLLARHAKQLEFLPKSAVDASTPAIGTEPTAEVLGFEMGAKLRDSLGELDLLALKRAPARRMFLVESTTVPSSGTLAAHLQELNVQLDQQHLPDHEIWMAAPDKSVVPGQILQSIVTWITRNAS